MQCIHSPKSRCWAITCKCMDNFYEKVQRIVEPIHKNVLAIQESGVQNAKAMVQMLCLTSSKGNALASRVSKVSPKTESIALVQAFTLPCQPCFQAT